MDASLNVNSKKMQEIDNQSSETMGTLAQAQPQLFVPAAASTETTGTIASSAPSSSGGSSSGGGLSALA